METGPVRISRPLLFALLAAALSNAIAASAAAETGALRQSPQIHFVPDSFEFWNDPRHATTRLPEGCHGKDCTPVPAYADVVLHPANFVQCKGGPFALCYYSGPNGPAQDLSCELTPDGKFANCNCYRIPYGTYFVDINAILNYGVYRETIEKCGKNGARCFNHPNKAPVCEAINSNRLIPGADLESTFSYDCIPTNGIGLTNCGQAPYAGCMTAPCYNTADTARTGIVQCSCPIFDGPYQVGLNDQECTLGGDLVWSAAYNPNVTTTAPTTGTCVPDAPGSLGCPLLGAPPYQVPAGIN